MEPAVRMSSIPIEREPHADYRRIYVDKTCDISQVSVHPGKMVPEHVHMDAIQTYIVLSGKGVVDLNGKKYEIGPGMAVNIPTGVKHSTKNVGDEPLVYVYVEAFHS